MNTLSQNYEFTNSLRELTPEELSLIGGADGWSTASNILGNVAQWGAAATATAAAVPGWQPAVIPLGAGTLIVTGLSLITGLASSD